MRDTLTVSFQARDFSPLLLPGITATPLQLSWSSFGGPQGAVVRLEGAAAHLFALGNLLRSPVLVSDPHGSPVWWGFVDRISLYLPGSQVSLSLDEVFNRVRVRYSFISPDGHLADLNLTDYASSVRSQGDYGIREKTLTYTDLDDAQAEALRDTFLASHAWPRSVLSSRANHDGEVWAELRCSGWFETLAWTQYQNLEGFIANYGPGPGSFEFADSSSRRNPGQLIRPSTDSNLEYAYFMLRRVGTHARHFQCRVFDDLTGASIAYSDIHTADELEEDSWNWVRFRFDPPFPLAGGSNYDICVRCTDGTNAYNYFSMRLDESQHLKGSKAVYYNGSSFVNMPSSVVGFGVPDCYFRVVCTTDTGSQLKEIAEAGNQFFDRVSSLTTGVSTSPYRGSPETCLNTIESLMMQGTSTNRLVLAEVSPQLNLSFYEQPSSLVPTAYMDTIGRFFSADSLPLPLYFPPVGQFVYLTGTGYYRLPWDRHRFPACFVHKAVYHPQSGVVQVEPFSSHPA
jgi:hypothetical protein